MLNKLKHLLRYLLLDMFTLKRRICILRANSKLSREEHERFEEILLLKTLKAAKNKIDKYKFYEIPKSDVKKFITENYPVVSKKDLLENRSLYYPYGGKPRLFQITGKTSGTTGSPLEILRSYNSICWENAFIKRHWQDICNSKIKRATLRGNEVSAKAGCYWEYNAIDSQLILSSKDLSVETFPKYVEIINEFKPSILQAYPSIAFQLAKYSMEQGIQIKVDYVFTASEMLYGYQREMIETYIGQVCDFYGMAERVVMATECKFKNLHVNTDYSFVEILDDNNQPTNEVGYIVGTTMHNYEMPLIRYKLSDRTKWKVGKCECGSHYPMIEPISGKFEDIIYDLDDKPVSPSLITFAFKGVNNIVKSQVAQTSFDKWLVRIVPSKDYKDSDGEQVIRNLNKFVSERLNVEVSLVLDIPSTAAGKFRWVLNETNKKESYIND